MSIINTKQAIFVGGISAYIYFKIAEQNLPKDSGCSFLAPISTDILAIAAGAIIVNKGLKLKEPILTFVGTSVLGIHFFQYLHFKTT